MKSFLVKLYGTDGTFLRTLPPSLIRNPPSFTARRNGGYGECTLDLALPFDDYGDHLTGMNIAKIEVADEANHPDGIVVYTGFISQVTPYLTSGGEGVKITLLGLVSLLAFDYYKNGSSFTVTHTTQDPAVILKAIIDHARTTFESDSGTPSIVVAETAQDGYETNNATWAQTGDGGQNCYVGTASPSGYDLDIGVIFPALDIPQGATIVSATVSGYGYGDASANPCKILVKGFAENNALIFAADGSNRPSTRPKTAASVAWEEDFPFAFGTRTSPDIKTVLQEIVDRSGWARGSNLGLVLENNASVAGTVLALQDYSNAGTNKLTLTVSWTYKSTLLNYDFGGTTVETVGSNVSITYADQKWIDALKKAAEAAGAGWYFLIDKTGQLQFHPDPVTATHAFTVGKDIEALDAKQDFEPITNATQVRYAGGATVDVSDATSIAANFRRGSIVTDTQLANATAATNRGNKEVTENKDAKKAITLTINSNYDIETISPGQTCKIRNVKEDLAFLGENLIIAEVKYELNRVQLQLERVQTDLGAEIVALTS